MSPRRGLAPLAVAAALYAVVVLAQVQADARRHVPTSDEELLYLPNQRLLNHFTAGMSSVVADLLWLKCVLYTGQQAKGEGNFQWLNQMLNTVVQLDPHFTDAYRYGGMFLSALKADDRASLDLLHRGIVQNPLRWELPYEAAMVYLLNRRDDPDGPRRTAIYLAMAAAAGDAPPYVRTLAEQLQGEYDLFDVEEQMWRQILNSPDQLLHDVALRKLQEVALGRACRAMSEVAQLFAQRQGRPPRDVQELVAAGLLTETPVDPLGGQFFVAPDGAVRSTTLLDAEKTRRLEVLQSTVDSFHEKNGRWPASLEELLAPGYFTTLPPHPYPGEAWQYDAATGRVS
jgi:hypothetical protein